MAGIFEKIVKHRFIVLAAAAVLTAVCAVLMTRVEVNTDMTRYLPDDSNMKQGVDILAEEFPDMENRNTIRVMFTGVDDSQADDIYRELESIRYVSEVMYDAGSEDYVKGDKRLFVLVTPYDYESPEEKYIIEQVGSQFEDYEMEVKDDNANSSYIPVYVLILAVCLLFLIMVVMCASWLEPVLFMVTIGTAIVINMGTNLFLDNVANITYAVAAILQLVLSMDYSIILSNRYRQEKLLERNRKDAMAKALHKAFSSVCSSSLTTFVGLLCLVFMSFKIGFNLGIVLAKGVICSLVCVLTVLPALLLLFDGGVEKTAKKAADIPTDRLAGFEYRHRKPVSAAFVLLFAAALVLQSFTGTTFNLEYEDPIADVFEKTNQMVVLYDNDIEDRIPDIAAELEEDSNVKEVQCYYSVLGREYTAAGMTDNILAMSGDADIDEDTVRLIYYMYHDGTAKPMTLEEFADFLDSEVSENDMFSDYVDEDMKSDIDQMVKYADRDLLTGEMTIAELAEFFGMKQSDVRNLFCLYYSENGGIVLPSMTLSQFADFTSSNVADNPIYGQMINTSQKKQIASLRTFSDRKKMTAKRSASSAASILGISRKQADMMYVLRFAGDSSYATPSVGLSQFVSFVNSEVIVNPSFSSQISDEQKAQLKMLSVYTDRDTVTAKMDAENLARLSGMDEALCSQIMMMNSAASMSLQELMAAVLEMQPDNAQAAQINQIISISLANQPLSAEQMAGILGMDYSEMRLLYTLYDYSHGSTDFRCSVQSLVSFISSSGMDSTGQMAKAAELIDAGVSGRVFSAYEMAKLTGMKTADMKSLYTLYQADKGDTSGWKLSPADFIGFMNSDVLESRYSSMIGASERSDLRMAQEMTEAVLNDRMFTPAQLSDMLGSYSDSMDKDSLELLFLYHGAMENSEPWWKMSVDEMFTFLSDDMADDSRFKSFITDDFKNQIAEYKESINEGKSQLVGENHSIMMINTTYPLEGDKTFGFISRMKDELGMSDSYIIGNSEMNYEMNEGFRHEMIMITLITALAIFLVVALTFRSVIIPIVLVLLVQCAVFLTVSYIGVSGNSIYYLAMLIVQCILMGATIDYAILYTSYYIENRKILETKESIKAAFRGSIHTILTSGLIICLVTMVLSYTYGDPSVEQICRTISIGAMFAILLILFVLPALLACLDKIIVRKKA